MPTWLAIAFFVTNMVVTIGIAYFASKRGVDRGLQVGVAVHGEQIRMLEAEMVKLRVAKHEHAQFLTRHEMDLEALKRLVFK